MAVDGSGIGLVVWHTDHTGDLEIRGRRLDASGAPVGSELVINQTTDNDQQAPAVAGSSGGGFVVVWQSWGQDGPANGIIARRFDAGGTPLTGEVIANETTSGNQIVPDVGQIGDGSFFVAWEDTNNLDGSGSSIQGRWFDAAATALAGDIQLNTYGTDDQMNPAVACAADEETAIVLWESEGQDGSNLGVFGQPVAGNGDPIGSELRFNTYTTSVQYRPAVARSETGTFWAVWASGGQDGSADGIYGMTGLAWIVTEIFADDFETGGTSEWSATVP